MKYLLLLLIIIPAIEIGLFIYFGQLFGVGTTILFIVLTGILGAYLAKRQGFETIRKAQLDMSYGRPPGDAILDGICVLIGGILILTPGFLTDLIGLFLLIPPTRIPFKRLLLKGIRKWMERGTFTIIR